MGDKNVFVPVATTTLVGVAAGLTPLLLDPRDDGVPGARRPVRIGLSRGRERDFFRDSKDPVVPNTLDAVSLDESDFITATTMI